MPLPILCLPLLLPPAAGTYRVIRPVQSAREAKAIAELSTGGIAVGARPIPLNGATGGWAVRVHMPKEDRGWLCLVDRDTRNVYTRTRIANPPPPK